MTTPFFVIPTLVRDLKFEEDEEKSFLPTNYTNFHEKRIGSWFSLASPIKTTAGFSIKRRIVLPVIPYSPLVIPTLGRDLIGIPGNGTKRESLPTNYTNFHERKLRLFRHLAIQPSSLVLHWERIWDKFTTRILKLST